MQDNFKATQKWAAERYGIKPEEIAWYNSGSCYDRIGVTTQEAADKVSAAVKGQRANGGMFDGMPLGSQQKNASGTIEVYC